MITFDELVELSVFESKVLHRIYGSRRVGNGGTRRRRNDELYEFYVVIDIVQLAGSCGTDG